MKKQWKQFATPLGAMGLLLITLLTLSCKKQDRTTVVFGTVKDEKNQPIKGVEMQLYGEKGVLGSRATLLKATETDAKGEYSITAEISKDYHSGGLGFNASTLNNYEGGRLYFNSQETKECCPIQVGLKSKYDWIFFRK